MGEKFKMKTTFSNLRVEIEIEEPWLSVLTTKSMADCAESFIREAKRHLDGWKHMSYEWDTLCKYCDSVEEYDDDGCPACCDEAIGDYDKWEKED